MEFSEILKHLGYELSRNSYIRTEEGFTYPISEDLAIYKSEVSYYMVFPSKCVLKTCNFKEFNHTHCYYRSSEVSYSHKQIASVLKKIKDALEFGID